MADKQFGDSPWPEKEFDVQAPDQTKLATLVARHYTIFRMSQILLAKNTEAHDQKRSQPIDPHQQQERTDLADEHQASSAIEALIRQQEITMQILLCLLKNDVCEANDQDETAEAVMRMEEFSSSTTDASSKRKRKELQQTDEDQLVPMHRSNSSSGSNMARNVDPTAELSVDLHE